MYGSRRNPGIDARSRCARRNQLRAQPRDPDEMAVTAFFLLI